MGWIVGQWLTTIDGLLCHSQSPLVVVISLLICEDTVIFCNEEYISLIPILGIPSFLDLSHCYKYKMEPAMINDSLLSLLKLSP